MPCNVARQSREVAIGVANLVRHGQPVRLYCAFFAEPRARYSLEDSMKSIKTYPSRIEADLAKIALDAAEVPSVVVGIGVGMEGGMAGVQLLVPEDQVEVALRILQES